MWGTILAIFTSGAGGNIMGGILALFKTAGERKERIELRRLDIEQDNLEYAEAEKLRAHERETTQQDADNAIRQTETEGDIAAEVATVTSRGQAVVAEINNLKTSQWVDNIRALMRPLLVTWAVSFFTGMFIWAFGKYSGLITQAEGIEILKGMFLTLNFAVNASIQFYLVARSNNAAKCA